MDLLELLLKRRSIRKYTEEKISEDKLEKILQAGLLAFSGRNLKPWEFVVVREKETIQKMAQARKAGAGMLTGADCAIVVFGNPQTSDTWVEDCSIAMTSMHFMATELGVGSCWIQGRMREAADGRSTEEFVKELLQVPEHYKLEAILSLGMPEKEEKPHNLEELVWEKVQFVSEDTPLSDEIGAIMRANKSIEENGLVSYDEVDWS